MKSDLKQVKDICIKYNMTKYQGNEFGNYIHERKNSGLGGSGKNGDFTFKELDELARDFWELDDERNS